MSVARIIHPDQVPNSRSKGHRDPCPRVVAVNRFYWPDASATSQLLSDLMLHLANIGWPDVTVITSRMFYDDPRQPLARSDEHCGVRVRRVWSTRHGRGRLAGRALDYLTFYLTAFHALMIEARRGDIVLVTTDPPLFALLAMLAARLKGARLVTWNHDLYPEVAAALGLSWAGGRFGGLLRRLRNGVLRAAAENVAISPSMAERISGELASPDHVSIIRNWCDDAIHPLSAADNALRSDWGLRDTFVIGYSGNLGRAHIPDKVAELVRRTRDIPGLTWLFIGGGAGLDQIRALAAEAPAGNIQVRPYHDRRDLARSLSVPDLHLVSLDPACRGMIFPSKIYGVMAAGRPMLFLGSPADEVATDLLRSRAGVTLDPDRPELWCTAVQALKADREALIAMGMRARIGHEALMREPVLKAWTATLARAAPSPSPPAERPVRVG